MDDLETARIRGEEARQFMANPLFKAMFDGVAEYLEGKALSCDPDNRDQAARVIFSKQILAAMKREIERRMEDGDMASFHLKELEKQRGFARIFRR